jgi:hypothetical protein
MESLRTLPALLKGVLLLELLPLGVLPLKLQYGIQHGDSVLIS